MIAGSGLLVFYREKVRNSAIAGKRPTPRNR